MSNPILFGVWAPDAATFWQSWVTAGICTAPNVFTPEYAGKLQLSTQTEQGWTPTRATGQMITDAMGNLVPERVPVSGWHCNVKVHDPALIAMFTHQLPQTDQDGKLLPLFERTWAGEVFQLTEQPADPTTGFPAGMRNSSGVTYADLTPGVTPFKSPTNTWA